MPSGADRAHALALLQRVYRYEGDQLRAAELGREALAEPADDQVRAEAASELASTLFFLRESLEEALSAATIAVDSSAHEETRGLHARAMAQKGVIEALVGHPDALATLPCRRGARGDRAPGFRHQLAQVRRGVRHALVRRRCTRRRASCTRSIGEALECGDDGSIPLILANLAVAEYLAGRWAQAEQAADDGYEAAMQTGQRPQQAYSLSVRALVRASLGREDEARVDATDALTLAGERAMGAARIHSAWALGLLELSLDRPAATVGPPRAAARAAASRRRRRTGLDAVRPRRDRGPRRARPPGGGRGDSRLVGGACTRARPRVRACGSRALSRPARGRTR